MPPVLFGRAVEAQMPVPKRLIEIGKCYEFDGGQIRKIIDMDTDRFQSIPHDGVVWGGPVWIDKDAFADEAQNEVQCPK